VGALIYSPSPSGRSESRASERGLGWGRAPYPARWGEPPPPNPPLKGRGARSSKTSTVALAEHDVDHAQDRGGVGQHVAIYARDKVIPIARGLIILREPTPLVIPDLIRYPASSLV